MRDVQTLKRRAPESARVESCENELVQKSDNRGQPFSDFVGFIVRYSSLFGFLDSPFSLLDSFCKLAGTGNSSRL